jgi:hypothetical protein
VNNGNLMGIFFIFMLFKAIWILWGHFGISLVHLLWIKKSISLFALCWLFLTDFLMWKVIKQKSLNLCGGALDLGGFSCVF